MMEKPQSLFQSLANVCSMDVNQMRQAFLAAYSGPGWKMKVNRMSDPQVIAVYFRLKQTNKI